MRYVLEALTHNVRRSQAVTVVERVFVNAGSRQYSTVDCDTMPAGFKGLGNEQTIGRKSGHSSGLGTISGNGLGALLGTSLGNCPGTGLDKLMQKTIQRTL